MVAKFPFLEIKCFCCNVNIDHGLHPFDKMDVIGGTFTTIEVLFKILEGLKISIILRIEDKISMYLDR